MKRTSKKKSVSISGPWLAAPLNFLRSRACAQLSPHAAKMLIDALSMLGPNARNNGDISLSYKNMNLRGWTSKETLHAAIQELISCGLLAYTRRGNRLDCSLFACTLYPIDCDLSKLDAHPHSYDACDYAGKAGELAGKPTPDTPARWRRVRKKTETVPPPRDDVQQ